MQRSGIGVHYMLSRAFPPDGVLGGSDCRSVLQVMLHATPSQVTTSDTITITWGVVEGDAEWHDWIGMFREKHPESASLRHVYCKASRCVFVLEPCI